jgi:hypothetical protein
VIFQPKPIPASAVQAAVDRAHHYRLLNEPSQAESICRDVLAVDPDNQRATTTLLLALTDQFRDQFGESFQHCQELLPRITDRYQRVYYEGIVCERWGRAQIGREMALTTIADWIQRALQFYEQAGQLAPPDDPDAILRWNTCARLLNEITERQPRVESQSIDRDITGEYGDDVPRF